MSTIRNIYNTLVGLVDTQASAVQSLDSAIANVRSDKATATRLLDRSVQTLVIADDAGRYAQLTKAAEYDFTKIVADWTAQDAANRKERAELETKWGSRQEVAHKAAELHEGITLIASALKEISPEIEQFDITAQKIKNHNEQYKDKPKLQITPESYDKYSKFGLAGVGRFLLWIVGYKGPHRAYKVVHEYQKSFGNYFEDSRDIADRKENEKKLQGEQAAKQATYDQYVGIGNRMGTLDNTYKGPEGIAQGIRGLVKDLALRSVNFVQNLLSELPGDAAQGAALATVKINNLTGLESVAARQYSQAESTLKQLKDPIDDLENALGRVGGDTISYHTSTLEDNVDTVSRTSKASARKINEASDAVDAYTAPAGTPLSEMSAKVKSLVSIQIDGNQLALEFEGLKNSVSNAVQAYEAEQARLREIERQRREAEAAREAKRLEDAFNSVSRSTSNNNSTWSPPSSPSISIGSNGIGDRGGSSSIGIGGMGISGR